ncbi:glycosyltransferase family 2 protein [Pedobacter kyonggii]|uniref:Glycosyltransferase family 2 protein n=1 Tax=Pedobacter kyonggii TaxID=1926871 RepID=A0A4Q9HES3_9SPHI|nr:glycosyltransferase family 2 protein [Pedobacter kyonggii]TBO43315.1 glycosyltransferase family 2 protein [Pedobacter kyonggii]
MDLSFIIINYNTTALTLACLDSIYLHTKKNKFEVIVIDNASPDASINKLKILYPETILIICENNIGFGRANNLAIERATGKYIFLLNSDTLLISDAAAVFFNYMEDVKNLQVACCGGALIGADGCDMVSYGNFPSFREAFSSLGFLKFYKNYYSKYLSSGVLNYSERIRSVDYLCGADMFLRKSVLKEIGVFDPEFFLYFEEVELSLRMRKAKYLSVILPDVKIIHYESASFEGGTLNLNKIQHMAISRRVYFRKSHGKLASNIINKIYGVQALIFLLVKNNSAYLKIAGILFKS